MKYSKLIASVLFLLLTLTLGGCGPKPSSNSNQPVITNNKQTAASLFQSSTNLRINVFYETGAEPFTGNLNSGRPVWDLACNNISHLFQWRTVTPTVTCPRSLVEMTEIGNSNKAVWSISDLVNLNANHNPEGLLNTVDLNIYFVNGFYESGDTVLGLNITGTNIMAIFKDVIKGSGSMTVQRFVEQSTIVHEVGHAFGLVNNGITMATDHQDRPNGNHTVDQNCVMYYLNEGRSDLIKFVQKYIVSGSVIMWGNQVQEDVRQFSR